MTKEEFKILMKALKEKESAVREEIQTLKDKWVAQSELKYGDKVRITQKIFRLDTDKPDEFRITECFVGNVSFRRYSDTNPELDYDFRAAKKDGTMSKSSAAISIWDTTKIEKI